VKRNVWLQRAAWSLLLLALLAACRPSWQWRVTLDGQPLPAITAQEWCVWAKTFPAELRGKGTQQTLPLERALWQKGVWAVEELRLNGQTFPWREAHGVAWLAAQGQAQIGEATFPPGTLEVIAPPQTAGIAWSLTDLAPTVAGALGTRSPKMTTGRAWGAFKAERVVVVVLEGLGYQRYQEVKGQRITLLLDSLGQPRLVRGIYPGEDGVVTASLLTGTLPQNHGVYGPERDKIGAETLLDVLAQAGKRSTVVQGPGARLRLGNAAILWAKDDNGDGSTDDDVVAQGIAAATADPPHLLWLDLRGLVEASQAYGIASDQELAKLSEIDTQLHLLIEALPADTLLLICGGYGLHPSDQEGQRAMSGSLLVEDMLVPLWIVQL